MQIPTTSDRLWSLADHFGTLLPILLYVWHWTKKKLKTAVQEAVREEIGPLQQRVEKIEQFYEVVKPNGRAVGTS